MYNVIRQRVIPCLIFILIAGLIGTGCANRQQGEHLSETRLLLDTYCTITIHGDVDSELLDDAFTLCAKLEALFSITIEDSDVWRINHAEGEIVEVHPRTIEVIKAGLEFSELSDGMFDITIGRLTRLWNFSGQGEQGDRSRVPLSADIDVALQSVENAEIFIDGNNIRLAKPPGESLYAWIDLGGIAKGYIADLLAAFLVMQGVNGAMIDLGGDVTTVGNRVDGNPWRIALRKPFGTMEEWIGIVEASDFAVVSSGIYERQFEKDGVIYHHILDPFTGMPVITDVVSAVIIAENALIGEGLSTIAVLVGSEKAPQLFEQVQGFICAVLILDDGEILVIGDMRAVTIGDSG